MTWLNLVLNKFLRPNQVSSDSLKNSTLRRNVSVRKKNVKRRQLQPLHACIKSLDFLHTWSDIHPTVTPGSVFTFIYFTSRVRLVVLGFYYASTLYGRLEGFKDPDENKPSRHWPSFLPCLYYIHIYTYIENTQTCSILTQDTSWHS